MIKENNLEEQTYQLAKRASDYANHLPKSMTNWENGRQLVRATGAVGSLCIKAGDEFGKETFRSRINMIKREMKECLYRLHLTEPDEKQTSNQEELIKESQELMKAFRAMVAQPKSN